MILFDYIYYRTFAIYKNKWNENDPKIYAISLVTLLQSINFISLFYAFVIILQKDIFIDVKYSFILFFLILIINLIKYRKKHDYDELRKKWSNEEITKKKNKGFGIIFYIFASILICILIVLNVK